MAARRPIPSTLPTLTCFHTLGTSEVEDTQVLHTGKSLDPDSHRWGDLSTCHPLAFTALWFMWFYQLIHRHHINSLRTETMSHLLHARKALDEGPECHFFKVILIVRRACSHAFSHRTLIETLRSVVTDDPFCRRANCDSGVCP